MKRTWLMGLTVGSLALSGCYRADITTGLAPSGQVIEDDWVLGFAGGLAMVEDVDASACQNGIASVMTRQSFLNVLVNILTSGIVTPMEVRVECAAASPGPGSDVIDSDDSEGGISAALEKAAVRSAETGTQVFVRFGK